MDISSLNWLTAARDPLKGLVNEDAKRHLVFRYMLEQVAGSGGLLVDLGAGGWAFAKIARDDGYAVTLVDTRSENKPPPEEQQSLRFVQSDVRSFDVKGFDVIVLVGLLHHLDPDDQMRMLKRCARENVPMILETQVQTGAPASGSGTTDPVHKPVMRGPYEGVVDVERDATMAWIGSKESFRPTEESVLRMFADAGFRKVAIVDPILSSKDGAHRFFLLNCDNIVQQSEAEIVKRQRNYITNLVNQGRFDEARELFEPISSVPTVNTDWLFEMAAARMRLHFGEREKAFATVEDLRRRALDLPQYAVPALVTCAQFFEAAGDQSEAEKTRGLAIDRLGNAAALKAWVGRLIAVKAMENARSLLAAVARRFAGDPEMLDVVVQSYQQLGDNAAAERVLRTLSDREPKDAAILEKLGQTLASQDKHEEAIAALERALALDPENAKTPERLAASYLKLKRFEEAEHHARVLLAVSPDNHRIHYYLASALRGSHRKQEAFKHAKRAAELDPANERYRQYADDLAKTIPKNVAKIPAGEADDP